MEVELLNYLLFLSYFVKPKCLVILYTICSPFFDFSYLDHFKNYEKSTLCFPILNLFDICYYIYYLNEEKFYYAEDSKHISFKKIFCEEDDYKIENTRNFLNELKHVTESIDKQDYLTNKENIHFKNIYHNHLYYCSNFFTMIFSEGNFYYIENCFHNFNRYLFFLRDSFKYLSKRNIYW